MSLLYILLLAAALLVLAFGYWSTLKRTLTLPSDADEIYTVTTDDLWTLRLYRYRTASRPNEPVLLVHSALANHRNFTTPAHASLVKTLTERGYDCWILELRGTRSSDPPHGKNRWDVVFDDYILQDLPAAVDAVASVTGSDRVHYVGHSLGGMVLYAYCLTHQDPGIASAATLGAPPGFVMAKIRPSYTLLGFYKTFPGLSEIFLRALTPFLKVYRPAMRYLPMNWENMHPDVTISDFFSMVDSQPPQVVSQLAYWAESNTWHVDHSQVNMSERLKELNLPLLAIFGLQDPFIPQEAARAFFESLPGDDKESIVLASYSHCDLAFGRNAEHEVFDPIVRWFRQHSMSGTTDAGRVSEKRPVNKRPSRKAAPKRKRPAGPPPSPEALRLPEGSVTIPEGSTEDVVVEATPEPVYPEEVAPETVTPVVVIDPESETALPPKSKAVTRRKPVAVKASAKKSPAPKIAAAKAKPAAKKPATKRKPGSGRQGGNAS